MSPTPSVDEVSDSLEELIEEHLKRINEKLGQPHSLAEIADSVSQLNDLLASYKKRSELLNSLVDVKTPISKKESIRRMLEAQHVRVAANHEECMRLALRSQQIIARSTQLVVRIRRQVDLEAHRNSGYLLETCGLCEGVGGTTDQLCPACKGKGNVLVHQPALQCPRCSGSGKPEKTRAYLSNVCTVCRGSGWVMTVDDRSVEDRDADDHSAK
jgi:predicted nucleic acid-binding Zn ribbon protein